MQYGYFDDAAREYVISNPETPGAWINYLMGGELYAFISQAAGGVAFYREPAEGRLTRYRFNGLPVDSPGFYLYIQDGETTWNPSFCPTRTPLDTYRCRHGLGYTTFESSKNGIAAKVTYTIPPDDPVLLWSVELTNTSQETRALQLSTYLEFSLHTFTKDEFAYCVCGNQWRLTFDPAVNGIRIDYFAFESPFHGQSIFASSAPVTAYEIDRERFIGPGRTEHDPIALERGLSNSEVPDGGRYACGALQHAVTLAPGETHRVLYRYAVSDDFAKSARLLQQYAHPEDGEAALAQIRDHWAGALDAAQMQTPDAAMNVLENTWFPYNSRVTFTLGRSISTRHTGGGGALRYRDSMQDALPAVTLFPADAKTRIAQILHTMYADGQCSLGVNPATMQPSGPREKEIIRSDAAVWGVFTVHQYLAETGDFAFLDAMVPYLDGGEGTVFEHLVRSLRFIAEHTGKDGLPSLFTVDWNDFLQIFTVSYTGGQSVMVAEQFIYAARLLEEIAALRGRATEVTFLTPAAEGFRAVLESDACWDGGWYRRLLGDNLIMGSRENADAQIFLNTQSWAVIAGTMDAGRTRAAMDAVYERLNTPHGIRLFAPPFHLMPDGVTRVPANTPGAGENGGIFLHANTWAVMAEALLGRGDRAWEYYSQILPVNMSGKDPERYQNEPYAFSSWVYGPDHERYGAGQLSWLTGGVAWMYVVGWEYILGIRPTLTGLQISPCIPSTWPGFTAQRVWRGTRYDITVENPQGLCRGRIELLVDGVPYPGDTLPPTEKASVSVIARMKDEG
ncbi:MAG: GH36-type glycosyl hydrolase domain-containing protein [Armatimonadota bacterium]